MIFTDKQLLNHTSSSDEYPPYATFIL